MKRLETFGLIKSQTNQNVSIGESLSKPKSTLNNTSIFDNKLEDLLSISQLAKKLNCSVSYVKKLRQASTILPCVCFGRFVRFKFSDVLAALEKRSLL